MPPDQTCPITEVATVFVPVSDQDRALAFYVDVLGFVKTGDFAYGGDHRWVEVTPPGGTNPIALVAPSEGASPGGDVVRCALATPDVDATHSLLVERGVDVDPVVGRSGTTRAGLVAAEVRIPDVQPPQVCFRDPDGNRFLLVPPPPPS